MKYCVVGFTGSRSIILLETISLFYNIPVIGEDIDSYRSNFEEFLTRIYNTDNGVIGFRPQNLINRPYPTYLPKIVDLESLRFEQYNQIFFTYRNVSDQIASLIVENQLGNESEIEAIIPQMTFSPSSNPLHLIFVEDYIYGELLVVSIKNYLSKLNLSPIDLNYDDVPAYLDANYPGTMNNHIETDYDYTTIFTNYSDIEPFYNSLKVELTKIYQENNI